MTRRRKEEEQRSQAEWGTLPLEKFGGVFVRPDIFSRQICAEYDLSHLPTAAPYFLNHEI